MEQFIVITLDGNNSFFLLCVSITSLIGTKSDAINGKMQLILDSFHIAIDTYFVICPKLAQGFCLGYPWAMGHLN